MMATEGVPRGLGHRGALLPRPWTLENAAPLEITPATQNLNFVVHGTYGLDGHTVDESFVKAENGNNDLPSFFDLMNASGSSCCSDHDPRHHSHGHGQTSIESPIITM